MKTGLRIGIDARELAGEPTGVGRYLAELVARWTRWPAAAHHHLQLFAPRALPPTAGWRGTGGATIEEIVVEGNGGSRWEQLALARRARVVRPDVWFAPGYSAPLFLRVPLVVSMHDVSFAAHPEWFRWREGARQRVVARWTARRARRVLTLTRFSRDEIVRHLRVPVARIEIVPPAVDAHPALVATDARDDPEPGPTGFLLYVGTIFTRRHVPETIAAFAKLARMRPDLRLVLVGADRSWPPQRIAERIATSDVAAHIDWHAWLPESALRRLYSGARAFVFLSEYEGFGLTPLEALRAGVPPVVADVPGAHEAYGDAAFYVDPFDSAEIASTLQRALEDDRARARVLEAGREILGRYSWGEAARRTLDVLIGAAS